MILLTKIQSLKGFLLKLLSNEKTVFRQHRNQVIATVIKFRFIEHKNNDNLIICF